MLKIFGVIAIVIATSLIGVYSSDKLKQRVRELNLISYMLEEIAILIRYKAMTVYEIVENLKSNPAFSQLAFLQNIEFDYKTPFRTVWENNIDTMQSSLNQADKKMLKSFGATLGTSDIAGQLSTIEVFKENFSQYEKEATEAYEKKSRLYRSLGVLAGAFIAVMLI